MEDQFRPLYNVINFVTTNLMFLFSDIKVKNLQTKFVNFYIFFKIMKHAQFISGKFIRLDSLLV